ncbi:MAG: hypothetical protein NT154_19635 [Verrucomicrobia bacterium]|nr:hypothetical protein [Verrucomicrobiota bacterium]
MNGHVIIAEPAYQERADFDWYRLFTRILWFSLLVVSPIIILRGLLVQFGALPALLAFIGVLFLLRFLTPTNLFMLLQLSWLLNPAGRREAELVPVRYFRVRQEDDSEVLVRMKGIVAHGNISQDDRVSLWGNWRRGNFQAQRGFNHRTESWVELRPSYSRLSFAVTVLLIVTLFCWFYHPVRAIFEKLNQMGVTR